jgi:hypothetical protein
MHHTFARGQKAEARGERLREHRSIGARVDDEAKRALAVDADEGNGAPGGVPGCGARDARRIAVQRLAGVRR